MRLKKRTDSTVNCWRQNPQLVSALLTALPTDKFIGITKSVGKALTCEIHIRMPRITLPRVTFCSLCVTYATAQPRRL